MNRAPVARRCTRHPDREAAAKCRACSSDFCRECAVEHEGVILCPSCLAREVNTQATSASTKGVWISRGVLLLSVFLAALFFYTIGNWLVNQTEYAGYADPFSY